jgi:hypothetical protein
VTLDAKSDFSESAASGEERSERKRKATVREDNPVQISYFKCEKEARKGRRETSVLLVLESDKRKCENEFREERKISPK